jgi:hypothetical protein
MGTRQLHAGKLKFEDPPSKRRPSVVVRSTAQASRSKTCTPTIEAPEVAFLPLNTRMYFIVLGKGYYFAVQRVANRAIALIHEAQPELDKMAT